ncbi:MAG: hypothetical protein LBT59_03245 [Clostridiales bacterium]|jgi:hypothetical protein|nr:hypothetical protein [Clostridiales bacterium]
MDYIDRIKALYEIAEDEESGFSESEIEEFEERKKAKLPLALRDYYSRLGKSYAVNASFNRLLGPDEAVFLGSGTHLVFYVESQKAVYWGIERGDMATENPEVHASFDPEDPEEEWGEDSGTTEGFLEAMAYWNGVLGGLGFTANSGIGEGIARDVEDNWERLEVASSEGFKFFTGNGQEIIVLTIGPDGIVNGIHVGASDEESFLRVMEKLDVEWDYRSDEDGE